MDSVKQASKQELQRTNGEEALAVAYAYLQKVVGIIAFILPFVVAIGDRVLDDQELRGSISAYYYGRTGNYFVGSLCALGVFFLSYDYRPRLDRELDNRLSNAAFLMAIGVALLPTPSSGSNATGGEKWVGFFHLVCAGILFGLLAVFSLYQFTKTEGEMKPGMSLADKLRRFIRTRPEVLETMTPLKRFRNKVYRTCGWIIVACIVAILLSNAFHWYLLFWLESIAVVAFGFSWLVKGGLLWADEG
ncbi:MAG: hypothetical protein AB7Q27_25315 [Acidimicrobiia bacterium]